VIQSMHKSKKKIAIAMEMVQYKYLNTLNDFVKGRITEKEMLDTIDYYNNWSFDYSLYAPIFKYARDNGIDIIPLNIERDVTSMVYQGQIDNLTAEQAATLPERMNTLNSRYENKIKSIFDMHAGSSYKFSDFFLSQNIWDEIMAKHLADYRKANPDTTVIVICGNGHAGKNSGIPLRYKRITGEDSFVVMQGEAIMQDEFNADIYIYTEEIKSEGTPKIGVSISTEEEDKGIVKVESVSKDSPAQKAGIKNGDIILKCGYHTINNIGSLKYALYEKGYNSVIECDIKRGKNIINKNIKLFKYDDSEEMEAFIKAHVEKMKKK
ncbi:MAG: ChaN family lipoprotein, partial [Candidatus Mucispirillum faecigallinarum]|nr:ChaN family lipoprotein [Candidatus Mucispirillum faecigallinarum]